MGFPDGYTAWGIDDKGNVKQMADASRYRMLGNSVVVPVVQWIGNRLKEFSQTPCTTPPNSVS